jgi:hypothetical protein
VFRFVFQVCVCVCRRFVGLVCILVSVVSAYACSRQCLHVVVWLLLGVTAHSWPGEEPMLLHT